MKGELTAGPPSGLQPPDSEMKHRIRQQRLRRFKMNIPLILMFVPVIMFYLTFRYAPIGGLVMAFKDYNFYDGLWNSPWVGFQHFQTLFSDPRTVEIIRNTLFLSLLSIIIGFPIPIILAIMLNEVRNMAFKRTVQTVVYMPHFFFLGHHCDDDHDGFLFGKWDRQPLGRGLDGSTLSVHVQQGFVGCGVCWLRDLEGHGLQCHHFSRGTNDH